MTIQKPGQLVSVVTMCAVEGLAVGAAAREVG
jgi:hypothetical protein